MTKKTLCMFGILPLLFSLTFLSPDCQAGPGKTVAPDERCPVCGMFVAKYEDWIVQARLADGSVLYFDGMKDLMVFYFNPEQYGKFTRQDIREIWVKDYYTLQWLDGFQAFYVIGSDVYGPMGMEFIAFDTREAAYNFLKDHKGTMVLPFEKITEEQVQALRTTKMRHGDK